MSNEKNHQRRFDTLEKAYLHIATALIIGLLGWQASNTAKNTTESVRLNETMISMTKQVDKIESNQNNLNEKVGKIQGQIRLSCERQNIYWPEHNIPCGEGK